MSENPKPPKLPKKDRPYRGSRIVPVRLPDELLALVDELVDRSQLLAREEPHTRSSFIVAAIEEKIKKMARSAKRAHHIPDSYERDHHTT